MKDTDFAAADTKKDYAAPPPVVIMRRPWVAINVDLSDNGLLRAFLLLALLASLLIIGFTTYVLIELITQRNLDTAVPLAWLLFSEGCFIFALLGAWALSG